MTRVLEEPTLLRARGADVALTSAGALARWPTIYVLEDNAGRAGRRQVEGLAAAPGHREVVLHVHAITRRGIETVAEDRYRAGELAHRAGRAAIALALIDAVKPARQAAVVAGPAYGDMRAFLEGLVAPALRRGRDTAQRPSLAYEWAQDATPGLRLGSPDLCIVEPSGGEFRW